MPYLNSIDNLAVYKAVEEIDERGWRRDRTPEHLWLKIGNKLYPPKIVIEMASGGEFGPQDYNSHQVCGHLHSLGFRIVSVKDADF